MEAGGKEKNASNLELLLTVEAHDRFLQALDAECGRQRRREVLVRVQATANEVDWEVFRRAILENKPIAEVAQGFQCKEIAVSAALYRVQRALAEEQKRVEEII
jgi:hypothetical protein